MSDTPDICEETAPKMSVMFGFVNDVYDYLDLLYIGVLKALIAAYCIIRHKCMPRSENLKTDSLSQEDISSRQPYVAPRITQEDYLLNQPPLALTEPGKPLAITGNSDQLALI